MAVDLEELADLIFVKKQPVTYKWLALQYNVSANKAKMTLFHFAQEHPGAVSLTFYLAGWETGPTPRHVLELLSADRLAPRQRELSLVTACHAFAVHAAAPHDPAVLAIADAGLVADLCVGDDPHNALLGHGLAAVRRAAGSGLGRTARTSRPPVRPPSPAAAAMVKAEPSHSAHPPPAGAVKTKLSPPAKKAKVSPPAKATKGGKQAPAKNDKASKHLAHLFSAKTAAQGTAAVAPLPPSAAIVAVTLAAAGRGTTAATKAALATALATAAAPAAAGGDSSDDDDDGNDGDDGIGHHRAAGVGKKKRRRVDDDDDGDDDGVRGADGGDAAGEDVVGGEGGVNPGSGDNADGGDDGGNGGDEDDEDAGYDAVGAGGGVDQTAGGAPRAGAKGKSRKAATAAADVAAFAAGLNRAVARGAPIPPPGHKKTIVDVDDDGNEHMRTVWVTDGGEGGNAGGGGGAGPTPPPAAAASVVPPAPALAAKVTSKASAKESKSAAGGGKKAPPPKVACIMSFFPKK